MMKRLIHKFQMKRLIHKFQMKRQKLSTWTRKVIKRQWQITLVAVEGFGFHSWTFLICLVQLDRLFFNQLRFQLAAAIIFTLRQNSINLLCYPNHHQVFTQLKHTNALPQ